jgi:hypothetical protein
MKKIMLLPLVFGILFAHAQVKFGLKAGVNVANFTGGDFKNFEKSPLTAFHAGGVVRWQFAKIVLQPEVLFSSQGAKLKDSASEQDYKVSSSTYRS